MIPVDLNVIVLTGLAGGSLERLQLARLAEAGFPGLRRSHGYVFQRLIDGSSTVGQLAKALGITQQGASKQVRELEDLGYVGRVPSPADARVRTIELTTRGRSAVETAREVQAALEAQVYEAVGPEKLAAAREALTAMLTMTGDAARIPSRSVPLGDA
jgi:DNA-binding MarR family transcriptional regulator